MQERMAKSRTLVESHYTVGRREPQTIAYALNDSPVGLAAWLWARRHDWSADPRSVEVDPDRDLLCASASIYWFTGSIGSTMRL
jgi:hypothetical protein